MDDNIKHEEKKVTIEITKEQVEDLVFLYETEFLNMIRNDEDIDNLRWVYKHLKLYDTLLKAAGQEGLEGSCYD